MGAGVEVGAGVSVGVEVGPETGPAVGEPSGGVGGAVGDSVGAPSGGVGELVVGAPVGAPVGAVLHFPLEASGKREKRREQGTVSEQERQKWQPEVVISRSLRSVALTMQIPPRLERQTHKSLHKSLCPVYRGTASKPNQTDSEDLLLHNTPEAGGPSED